MNLFEAVILAIVEGVTEFLPISSTGHMVITSSLLGIHKEEFTKLFEVAIQFGAILAVVVLYARKFFQFSRWQFYVKLLVGVIPALVLGYLFSDRIDAMLESPLIVAITMLLGGIVLLFIDNVFKNPTITKDDQITYGKSFLVGIWQCLALIPGVSRSAASIIGGMQQKFTRQVAAEFSFFLAVPTMFAASVKSFYDVYKDHSDVLVSQNYTILAVGAIVSFIVALIAVKSFIHYLQKHGFKAFGIYRIILGAVILILIWRGVL